MSRANQVRNMRTVTPNSPDPAGAHRGLLSTRPRTHSGVLPEESALLPGTVSWGAGRKCHGQVLQGADLS